MRITSTVLVYNTYEITDIQLDIYMCQIVYFIICNIICQMSIQSEIMWKSNHSDVKVYCLVFIIIVVIANYFLLL